MAGPFDVATGTYTGTAGAQSVTLGFKPSFVLIVNETDGDSASIKIAGSTDATHVKIELAPATVASQGVTLTATGFSVGTDNSVSENLKVFRYFACRE